MFPSVCVTVTDHGSDCREPAREVDGLAGRARGRGEYILGRPVCETARAIDGSSP